jgi:hypothetical protein
MPGYANPIYGRGFGAGFGRGRGFRGRGFGWRNRFNATGYPGWMNFGWYPPAPQPYQASNPEREKQALKNQFDALQSEIEIIRKRLSEIDADSASG